MLRAVFAVIVSGHGLIHLLGFVKAFGLAPLEQLRAPIARPMGILWLIAAILIALTVAALFFAPRWFWALGALGLVASQMVICCSWSDARFGTVANGLLLAGVIYGVFAWGPFGLRAEYERLVRESMERMASAPPPKVVTEEDLAPLPSPVQRYLRFVGAVGQPRPLGFRARMKGRIRSSERTDWMSFEAEQVNFYDSIRRYFWMDAKRAGLPVDVLHAYGANDAGMRVRVLSMIPAVDLQGPEAMRTETVTILNDMSIFAPGALLDSRIAWRELDPLRVEATLTNGPHTVRAVLVFDESGALVDFWSDDRPMLGEDGKTMTPARWSTPLREYGIRGPLRLATRGEGRYAPPEGDYAYLELEILEVMALP